MSDEVKNEIRQISRIQRRVLGVLMEKAFTTPDQYPLTLKAATTGCNQKNNRDPLTDYSEDQVADALEQLQQMGLVAEVYTDGGRAPRYRHYMRHKFDFSETQFAVIAELLLRGQQQPGELRTRASRMVKIESQDHLKSDLQSLQQKGFVQSNGPLERRGVEVDHTFYLPKEGHTLAPASLSDSGPESSESPPAAAVSTTAPSKPATTTATAPEHRETASRSAEAIALQAMTQRVTQLSAEVEQLKELIETLTNRLERIETDLGI